MHLHGTTFLSIDECKNGPMCCGPGPYSLDQKVVYTVYLHLFSRKTMLLEGLYLVCVLFGHPESSSASGPPRTTYKYIHHLHDLGTLYQLVNLSRSLNSIQITKCLNIMHVITCLQNYQLIVSRLLYVYDPLIP